MTNGHKPSFVRECGNRALVIVHFLRLRNAFNSVFEERGTVAAASVLLGGCVAPQVGHVYIIKWCRATAGVAATVSHCRTTLRH